MTTNSSSELPKKAPFFALTPTMRKWTPATLIELVERIGRAEQPIGDLPAEQRDRAVALDLDRAHHPAALGVEGRELE